jgi:FixJ family two-component response regulator
MPVYSDANVLILDDDPDICTLFENIICMLGMKSKSALEWPSAMDYIKSTPYDIVLLDVKLAGINGLDVIPEIKKYSKDTHIIVMTGYADKEMAVQALRLGAFDFLEKPFGKDILSNSLYRALKAIRADREIKNLVKDLQYKTTELLAAKENMEFLNDRLIETNKALSLLAQNIEREREGMEKRISLRLKSILIPAIDMFRKDQSFTRYKFELDILVEQIEDLTSTFSTDGWIAGKLSFCELRIASLIKNGLSTEQIAEYLHVSASTVRTHRKRIRKKLGINDAQYSLRNFLSSKHLMT